MTPPCCERVAVIWKTQRPRLESVLLADEGVSAGFTPEMNILSPNLTQTKSSLGVISWLQGVSTGYG